MEAARPSTPREERRPQPAGQDEVRVAGSPVRCPFCHEDVRREAEAWVACAGCMARHHQDCWDEAGRCGSCGGAERLAPERRAGGGLRRLEGRAREEVPWSALLGAPARVKLEETFQGEASVADAPWLEAELRRALRARGRLELTRDGLRWRTQDCRQLVVQLVAADGRTRLVLEEDVRGPGLGVLGGIGGGVGGGSVGGVVPLLQALVPGAGGPLTVAVCLAWVVGFLLLLRALVGRAARQRPAQLRRLRDRLARGLEAGPYRPTPPRAPAPPEPGGRVKPALEKPAAPEPGELERDGPGAPPGAPRSEG